MIALGAVLLSAAAASPAGAYVNYGASSTATSETGRTCTMRLFGYSDPAQKASMPTDRIVRYGSSSSCNGSALPEIRAFSYIDATSTGLSCAATPCPPNHVHGCNTGSSGTLCSNAGDYVGLNIPTTYNVSSQTITTLPPGERWVSYGGGAWGCSVLGNAGSESLYCIATIQGRYGVNSG